MHRTACKPSCSSGLPLRIGTMAGNSLSRALSGPQTRKACGLSVGGHAALACARPAVVGRSLRHAPCTHGLLLVRLMAHQHSPARASRRRPHTNPHAHAMHRPDAQGKGSRRRSSDLLAALASNPLGCLKASGGRRNARTGLPLSFLRWQASCAPQGRGRNTPTHQAQPVPRTWRDDPGRLNAPASPRSPATGGQMRRLLLCRMVRLLARHSPALFDQPAVQAASAARRS